MRNRYFIIITSFFLCFPAWACAGAGPRGSSAGSTIGLFQEGSPNQTTGRYLAQNDTRQTPVNSADGSKEKNDKDTTRPDTPKKEKNASKKTKLLKPFVPSEKIPADQGVDFPYDI